MIYSFVVVSRRQELMTAVIVNNELKKLRQALRAPGG
jgi:hypothetical protein